MVMGSLREETEVAIIGGGPGGYVAAIRAADLGKEVLLIEEREELGGTCLLEGCIPSKALIRAVELIEDAREAKKMGLKFGEVVLDLDGLRKWTGSIVEGLSKGVDSLLKKRGIEVLHGKARFENSKTLVVEGTGLTSVDFKDCIIATGSDIRHLPVGTDLPLWTSADAVKLPSLPQHLLVIGGGYIGLELGLVYAGLGSKVSVVEFSKHLLMGPDLDLVEVVIKNCEKKFDKIYNESKVISIEKSSNGYVATLEHDGGTIKVEADQIFTAVGRQPRTGGLGLEHTKVTLKQWGFVQVDQGGRTTDEHIFAIGDITPGPMLAHKASREGRVVAEVIAGHPAAFDNRAVPAVVFTSPELAWTGLTERAATEQGLKVTIGRFPIRALGRARTLGHTEGLVKILTDPDSGLVLGIGMVGSHVSELIAEGTLAVEMGATLEDLMVTIHPHPTMSEAMNEAAEVAAGMPIHINPVK